MHSSSKALAMALAVGQAFAASNFPSIVMKGTKFFYENGTQFFIKGIAYQQDSASAGGSTNSSSYIDPLSDKTICSRDIPIMQKAGTNVIRTYAIDPTADHADCMSQLQDAGIYVISDLSEPSLAINRDDPKWDLDLYKRYTGVVDAMAKYPNTIGFFAGNEVTNNASNTAASAFVKAAVRDMKSYIKSTQSRWLGVGYAANDDADIRANIAHYFNCGNQSDAIDFWGYNIYEWCGENTFQGSGYKGQVDFFSNYSVPVFFAEYGCNTVAGAAGRIFQETTELYSNDMTGVISGGIVYMYFEETNDYGLVSIVDNKASTLKAYNSLSSRIAAATPSSTASADYSPTNSPAACPAVGQAWKAQAALPPKPDQSLCECMYKSASCVPASDLSTKDYGALFNYICGADAKACAGTNANATTGVYGAYSMCNSTQKLAYVMDAYYQAQGSSDSACDFSGKGAKQKSAADSSCKAALASASSANAVAATATGATTGGGAAAESSKSFAVPVAGMRPGAGLGGVAVGAYVLVAMGVGAAMVAL